MAVLDLIAFPSLLLEDDYLVVLQVFENGCADCGPFHYRCADLDLTVSRILSKLSEEPSSPARR